MVASRDLFRFTTAFYDAITNSTPHLYISALSWAPVESYLSKTITSQFSHQPAALISGKGRQWRPILWSAISSYYFNCVQFSPDGNHLATFVSNYDWEWKSLMLWDAETGENKGELRGEGTDGTCYHVQFSFDSKDLFACDGGGILASWNIATRKQTMIVLEDVDKVFNFRLSSVNNEIAILLGRKSICIWNLSTRKRKFEPIGLDGSVSCIRYSPKGEYIAIGFENGSIRVMNSSEGILKNYTLLGEDSHYVDYLIFRRTANFFAPVIRNLWISESGTLLQEGLA